MNIPTSFGLRISGIYCITNSFTQKKYIGSSKNIYHRLKRHYSELERKVHCNPYLLNSYVKHGKNMFEVSILEEVPENLLKVKEQEYIDFLKPEYNITLKVVRNILSPESRRKISETLKRQKALGLLKYPTHEHKKKPVVIYDLDCNCVGEFESERAAGKKLEELYSGLKNSQAVVNTTVNLKGRRKVSRYKRHFLLRTNQKCVSKNELFENNTYTRQYSS